MNSCNLPASTPEAERIRRLVPAALRSIHEGVVAAQAAGIDCDLPDHVEFTIPKADGTQVSFAVPMRTFTPRRAMIAQR